MGFIEAQATLLMSRMQLLTSPRGDNYRDIELASGRNRDSDWSGDPAHRQSCPYAAWGEIA